MELREEKISLMEMLEREGPNTSMASQEINTYRLNAEELKGQIEYLEEENQRLKQIGQRGEVDKERIMRLERMGGELQEKYKLLLKEKEELGSTYDKFRIKALDSENRAVQILDQIREELQREKSKNQKLDLDLAISKKKGEIEQAGEQGKQGEIQILVSDIDALKQKLIQEKEQSAIYLQKLQDIETVYTESRGNYMQMNKLNSEKDQRIEDLKRELEDYVLETRKLRTELNSTNARLEVSQKMIGAQVDKDMNQEGFNHHSPLKRSYGPDSTETLDFKGVESLNQKVQELESLSRTDPRLFEKLAMKLDGQEKMIKNSEEILIQKQQIIDQLEDRVEEVAKLKNVDSFSSPQSGSNNAQHQGYQLEILKLREQLQNVKEEEQKSQRTIRQQKIELDTLKRQITSLKMEDLQQESGSNAGSLALKVENSKLKELIIEKNSNVQDLSVAVQEVKIFKIRN